MNEQAIFLAAMDITDPTQRTEYLNRTCTGDPTLRRQVEALLAAHERSGEFLNVPALQQMAAGASGDRNSQAETSAEQHDAKGEIDLSFLQPPTKPGSLGRLGHYEVQAVIGRGGCGIVLKAFDEMLHRAVAIKVMAPELASTSPARKRFLREARAAAAIRHENVVSIHSVEDQPIPFLVMEYIAGQTLQQKLDQTGPLDVREVVQIGHQIASGLEAAHAMGLIHRDIKPGNVLLEKGRDRVKITDFGLARATDDASLTQSGVIAGTPLYMSPEQAMGDEIDQRSDLFSLGSVLYVMCSGRPPFRASTTLAVLKRVAEDQPRPIQEIIPEVPEWLRAFIAKLHAKNPDDRFASAQEVAGLLARCLSELQLHGNVDALVDVLPTIPKPMSTTKELAQREPPKSEERPAPALDSRPSLPRSRRWVVAAAMFLMLLAGLSLTEATGVTNVRGTVIRLFSPDGTLVVEVDDPGVSVTIDGEEMVITGTGAKEIRLKPGQYKVLASKDGKLVRQELVTVTRNGRQVVRVSKEVEPVVAIGDGRNTADPLPQRHKNTLGMEFALVPKGKAWLGGGGGFQGNKEVEFKDDFYLGVYEVTQEEWEKVTGLTPSHFSRTGPGKDAVKDIPDAELKRFPVEVVSWDDAQLFLERLNKREKEVGWVYRLPKEAEWEYACRNGPLSDKLDSAFDFYFDKPTKTLLPDQANIENGKGLKRTCKVGSYQPNRLGLFDMHGNIFEWCDDVNKGLPSGSWLGDSVQCAAARYRFPAPPSFQSTNLGLRVARVRVGSSDPDRRAAEWVLSIGCPVDITENGQVRNIKVVGELPSGAFELRTVWLQQVAKVTDSGLANFKGCKNITLINLTGTLVSDAGLANFKDCKDLLDLQLQGTRVGDAGLAHFKDCKFLAGMNLNSTQVSDAGLAPFKHFENLSSLSLPHTKVTDAGLAHVAQLKNLAVLHLRDTQVTDAGLAHLKAVKHLTNLDLAQLPVTDAGLIHLKDLANLAEVSLDQTHVTDKGIDVIGGWSKLKHVRLQKTKVTEAGVKKLAAKLPQCKIAWDGGVIESNRFTNSLGMEFAIVPKGKSWLGGGGGVQGNKEVEFKDDFYLGVYEVTQEEWVKVTGLTPSSFSRTGASKNVVKDISDAELKRYPVDSVSWDDAQLFLERLNNREKEAGWMYRLPTEAEWEYACRGGPLADKLDSAFDFYFDKPTLTLLPEHANFALEQGKGSREPRKVGSYKPNRLGLYDMHGNVFEWCNDAKGADAASPRAHRGGGWQGGSGLCPAASSAAKSPSYRDHNLGLRVARVRVATDPDRRAAEWVLSIGGGIGIKENGQERPIAAAADLPKGPFELTVVTLTSNAKVSDAGLANFTDCKNLTSLDLAGTKVSDAGLVHFKDCKNLTSLVLRQAPLSNAGLVHFADCKNLTLLDLGATKVSDAGLAHFKNCQNLKSLQLNDTLVSDAGLAHFKDCKNLTSLNLGSTQVSDAGLAHFKDRKNLTYLVLNATKVSDAGLDYFKDCKNLSGLHLWGTKVTDAGLTHFKDCKNFTTLNLAAPQVSDAGLTHFKDCKNLFRLDLSGTKVSDAGLANLAGCPKLGSLSVLNTKVTEAGVKKLSAALPGCKIEWDGGVIEPTAATNPDRRAAEWVLSIGGSISIKENDQERQLGAAADLPKGPFQLTVVTLTSNAKVSDAGLANFTDCKNLTSLDLGFTKVSDAGLAHFKDCRSLTVLDLHNTQASDAGLAVFKDCKNLAELRVAGTQVSDAGLAVFKDCQNLTYLYLAGTQVGDAGLAHFKDCQNVTKLVLHHAKVSDAGLTHFKDYKDLTILDVHATQVGDAGLAHLKDCKNLTTLILAGTQVSDAGLAHIAGCLKLSSVNVKSTKVTEVGVKKLAAALPKCKIEWDGGGGGPQGAAPPPGGQAGTRPNDYDKLATGRWIPVLAGPGKSIEPRNAVFSNGLIEISNGHAYDKTSQAADVIVRTKVQKLAGQIVLLTLRDVLGVYYSAVYQNDGVERFGVGTRDTRFRTSVKQHFEAAADVKEGEFFELAFAAVGDTLTVYANGKRVGEIRDSSIARPGGVAVHTTKGRGVFKDVEVMVLDKPAP